MIFPSDQELRAAMSEGLRVMLTRLPAYQPDLPIHRGYDIVLLVRPHDQHVPQVMSNLMPDVAYALMAKASDVRTPAPLEPEKPKHRTKSRKR
jgi:hypothetical protein